MLIDILAQIGFVVLVRLAAKNAILIVEFARQRQAREGDEHEEAATAAAQTRLRPILMTCFAFILGVAPLAVATGSGAEMRQSLGTAVLFGMLGVTGFGLLFTPVFYTFIRKWGRSNTIGFQQQQRANQSVNSNVLLCMMLVLISGASNYLRVAPATRPLAPFR